MAVNGMGNKKEAANTSCTNFFLFSFQNSHLIKLSNSLTSCYFLEVILQSILTKMRFLNINAGLDKRTVYPRYRKSCIIEVQIIGICKLNVLAPKCSGNYLRGFLRIRYAEMNIFGVFSLQFFQAFFLQQPAVADNPHIIRQQGDF